MARFGGSIVREVGGHDNNEAGRVRLAAPDGLAGFLIIPALATFQRANPQIHLALDCGLWPESPVEGETDLSLEFTDTCAADVVSIPLATLHYGYYASQEYLDLYGTPRTLTEVAEHRMVHHTSHKEQSRTWHPKFSFVTGLAGMHLVSNSSAATLMAIKHGVGLGILPTFMANLEPELVLLDLDPMAHPVMFLRHHAAAERQGRVKRVKEWLIDLFDPTDQPWYREEYIHPRDFHRSRPGPNPGKAAAALRRR
jgi:DNA-binding transcriptional LysR family regulator